MGKMTVTPPPQTRQRDDSAIFASGMARLESSNATDIFDDLPWNPDEPTTWPILFLPFHDTSRTSRPIHIDDLTEHVHYKGAGAAALRMLLYEELLVAESEEEKLAIEFEAYLRWPFNITRNGYWKDKSGLAESEIVMWKETKRRVKEWDEGLWGSKEAAGESREAEC